MGMTLWAFNIHSLDCATWTEGAFDGGFCSLNILNEAATPCNDNGTGNDPSDDIFGFNFIVQSNNGGPSLQYMVNDGSMDYGPFAYGISNSIVLPADGNAYTIIFSDVDDPTCQVTTTTAQNACSLDCTLALNSFDLIECNNNMTPIEPIDDYLVYDFNLSVSNCPVGSTFSLMDSNGNTYGPYAYGTTHSVVIPAFGGDISLTFSDGACNCSITEVIDGDPCSFQCGIIVTQSSSMLCEDNGTPSDPSDDTFDVIVNAEPLNSSVGNQFTVTNGVAVFGPFDYFVGGTITLPADGSNTDIFYTDVDDPDCVDFITVSMQSCSNLCVFSVEDATIVSCDDNGTNSNSNDDAFTVNVDASAINPSATNEFMVSDGLNTYGPFEYGVGGQVVLPADGSNIQLTYFDLDDNTCSGTTIVNMMPCSSPCTMNIDEINTSICFDNATLTDPTDDTFTVIFNISAVNAGPSGKFTVSDGTSSYGPYDYGIVESITLPANGNNIALAFTDSDDPACSDITVVSMPSCSNLCTFSIDEASSNPCNNNGTPSDPSDDFFTVNVNASAVNPGMTNQYVINAGANVFGPFDYGSPEIITLTADASNIDLIFIDVDNPNCTDTQSVSQNSCSDECAFSIDGLTDIGCDDNGTPGDSTDDFFTVQVNASSVNGGISNQFLVTDGVNVFGPFTYGIGGTFTLSADGNSYNLIFSDVDDSSCSNISSISSNHCSGICVLTIEDSVVLSCFDNNTPNNPTDDIYEVSVDASIANGTPGSNEFTVSDGTNTFGPFTYGNGGAVQLPADGNFYTLVYEDISNPGCSSSVEVSQQPCSGPCDLSMDLLDISECNDAGTTEDPLDDTYQVSMIVNAIVGGGNANQYNIVIGPDTYGPFQYGSTASVTLSADGITSVLNIVDTENSFCNQSTTVNQSACSGLCTSPITNVDYHVNQPQCSGDRTGQLVIDSIYGGSRNFMFSFDNENFYPNDSVPHLFIGAYDFYITDSLGCTYDFPFEVEEPFYYDVDLGPDTTLLLGESVELFISTNIPLGQFDWAWSDTSYLDCTQCINPTTSPAESIQYIIEMTSPDSCFISDTLNITVLENYNIYIPNAFSPNGDGFNDLFTVYPGRGVAEIQSVRVFDRWGSLVYEQGAFIPDNSTSIEIGWDGTLSGRMMNPAVFVYAVDLKLDNGEIIRLNGDVTLLK